ncbi:hypothetical protein AB9P05_19375 [Roseivirga sp. BDSF3-8]|uniref:hypothetical protein n=1 Tax=Roseivirga sp. BDSF3-8 TaxID=3241598 RepID=UPI00353244F3
MNINVMKKYQLVWALIGAMAFTSCGDDDAPDAENPEEIITGVTLTFTPTGGGSDLVFTATDPDGEGPEDLAVSGPIQLSLNTTYELSIGMEGLDGEDIGAEVAEEDEEHQLFFSWTDGLFSSPAGNGNIDNADDDVDYLDVDGNGLPVGLLTEWSTSATQGAGTFRVILKHQPDIKSATSTSSDGETDVDLTWVLQVQE